MIQKILIGAVGSMLFTVLNVVSNAWLARIVGPSVMGQYQVILSVGIVIITVAALGIGDATVFSLNNLRINRTEIHGIVLLWALFAGVVVFTISYVVYGSYPAYFGELSQSQAALAAGAFLLLLVSVCLRPLAMADLKIGLSSIASNVGRVIFLMTLGIFYVLGDHSITEALAAYCACNGVITLILLTNIDKRLSLTRHSKTFVTLFSLGVKFAAVNVLVISYSNISIILLNALHTGGLDDIGIYSRAVAVSNLLTLIPSALAGLFLARWALPDIDVILLQMKRVIRLSTAVSIVFVLFIHLFGPEVIRLLYGQEYVGATKYLTLLAAAGSMGVVTLTLRSFLVGRGEVKALTVAFLVSNLTLGLGILCLYPKQGLMAGPISLTISNFTLMLLSLHYLRRYDVQVKDCLIVRRNDLELIHTLVKSRIKILLKGDSEYLESPDSKQ